jgi:hypothetical protein
MIKTFISKTSMTLNSVLEPKALFAVGGRNEVGRCKAGSLSMSGVAFWQ